MRKTILNLRSEIKCVLFNVFIYIVTLILSAKIITFRIETFVFVFNLYCIMI